VRPTTYLAAAAIAFAAAATTVLPDRPVAAQTAAEIAAPQSSPRLHELPLAPANVHWGYYDSRIPPVLRIASGDRVRVETMVARGLQRLKLAGVRDEEIPGSMKAVEQAITDKSAGPHPMTGPIYVEGAEPGDALEIRIVSLEFLHPFGVAGFSPGGGVLPDDFPYAALRLLRWQPGADRVELRPGVSVKLAPFWGSIGVAPPALSGRIPSGPPGWHGGNIDNKDLVVGSVLYLPVHVAGGLLSIGDGHAMQGDGEVTGTALETSLRGVVEVRVRTGARLRWPRAETPTHYIAMGLDPDLDRATQLATREMVAFLVEQKHLSADDAYVLCSLAADLHVTQAVDGVKGVHASIPKTVFVQ
jgi:acetamidase/formamidase